MRENDTSYNLWSNPLAQVKSILLNTKKKEFLMFENEKIADLTRFFLKEIGEDRMRGLIKPSLVTFKSVEFFLRLQSRCR